MHLEAIRPDGLKDVTPQEVAKLMQHFKDPEFCRLFQEVAKDLTDPQAKAEQDAYLAQLEAEQRVESIYGSGAEIIRADPGFVIKTKTADGVTRVYINVCTTSRVDKIKIELVKGKATGQNICIPSISNKASQDGVAPDSVPIKCYHFLVHPATLTTCLAKPALLECLVTVAIEKVEQAGQQKLLRKYKLPALRYKGLNGEQRPAAMLLRTATDSTAAGLELQPRSSPNDLNAAAASIGGPPADTTLNKDAAGAAGCSQSSFTFKSKAKPSSSQPAANKASVSGGSPSAPAAAPGVVTPRYQVVERARHDLAQAWHDAGRGLQLNSNVPEALIVRIELPGVSGAAAVELDVEADAVRLEVPGRYKLHLPLRYTIQQQEATAKYHTTKQQMTLTLPVKQPALQSRMQQGQHIPQPRQQVQKLETQGSHVQQSKEQGQQQSLAHKAEQQANIPGNVQQEAACPQQLQQPCLDEAAGEPQQPSPASNQASPSRLNDVSGSKGRSESEEHQQTGYKAGCQNTALLVSEVVQQTTPAAGEQSLEQTAEPGNSSPHTECSKTANQLRWEELHRQTAQDNGGKTASTKVEQASDRRQHGQQQQQQEAHVTGSPGQQLSPRASSKGPALWQPRLSSSRVCTSDFI